MKTLKKKRLTQLAVGLGALVSVGGLHAQSANAWANSGSVTLQGSSYCASGATTWVWVSATNGEYGWATNGSGKYRFSFRSIPTSGTKVTVNYGSSTFKCTDTFGVQRPTIGTSATRNLFKLVANA